MADDAQAILEAGVLLLQQFLDPDEETLTAILAAAGNPHEEEPPTDDFRAALTRALRPREEDYARVFLGAAAERAREGYEALWADPWTLIAPKAGQTQLRVLVAQAATLRSEPEVLDAFPGGYRDVLDLLVPDRYWICWEFLSPDEPYGMQYNGLVYLDERFVWFPKPWRVFERE